MTTSSAPIADFVEKCGLPLSSSGVQRLEQYCQLLWDWNQKLNLTRHTTYEAFITRDLVDTHQLAMQLDAGLRVLDMGSGGGVPGIPLAVLRPDLQVTLAESIRRKAAALESMAAALQLNVPVYAERVEAVLQQHRFDVVTARAVAPLSRLLEWLQPCWQSFDGLYLIKGPRWRDEQAVSAGRGQLKGLSIDLLSSWSTPGRDGDSVLLRIGK